MSDNKKEQSIQEGWDASHWFIRSRVRLCPYTFSLIMVKAQKRSYHYGHSLNCPTQSMKHHRPAFSSVSRCVLVIRHVAAAICSREVQQATQSQEHQEQWDWTVRTQRHSINIAQLMNEQLMVLFSFHRTDPQGLIKCRSCRQWSDHIPHQQMRCNTARVHHFHVPCCVLRTQHPTHASAPPTSLSVSRAIGPTPSVLPIPH